MTAKYPFTDVPPGELDYTITASGYDTTSGQLEVNAGTAEYTLELAETVITALEPAAKNIVFTISTGTNGNPGGILTIIGSPDNDVQNFVIAAGVANSQQIELAYGNYSFKFIPDGDTVTAPG